MNDLATETPDARDTAMQQLAQGATSGNLTLGEYAERATAIEQAATTDEIHDAVQGLPEQAPSPAHGGRWIIALLGGTEQRGRWRLSRRLQVISALGGATLDLSTAQAEASESTITVVAVLGGAKIIVPPGVSLQLSGFSLLGGKGDKRAGGPPLPGSPLVHVRAFTFLGGVSVEEPKDRRNLLEIIRRRRATEPDA